MTADALWHLRGSVPLPPDVRGDAAIDRLERMLHKQRKLSVERNLTEVIFYHPIWRVFTPSFAALHFYGRGQFRLESKEGATSIRYSLTSFDMLVYCAMFAAGSAVFGVFIGEFQQSVVIGAVLASCVYGMNMLLALARAPRLIRRTVRNG